ncbi:MAG: hypothetical protein C0174_00190 [Thermodesulfobium narugense]|nr:MAG: hypothetical protein C0174_00190 [Thermodesulfobium narugense]
MKNILNCEISKRGFTLLFVVLTMFFIIIALSITFFAIKNSLNTNIVVKTNANYLIACEKAINDAVLKLSLDPEYSGENVVVNSIPVKIVVNDIGLYKKLTASSIGKSVEVLVKKELSIPKYALAVRKSFSSIGHVKVITKTSDSALSGVLINYLDDSYPNIFFESNTDGILRLSQPTKINFDESLPFWQEYLGNLKNLPSGLVINYLDPANNAPVVNFLNCNQTYLVPLRLGTNLKINNLQSNCKITFFSDVSTYGDLFLPSNVNFDFNGQLFVKGNLFLDSKEVNIKNGLIVLSDLNFLNSSTLNVGDSLFVKKNLNLTNPSKLIVNNGVQIKGDLQVENNSYMSVNKALNVEGDSKIYGQLVSNNSQLNFDNLYILDAGSVDSAGSNVYINKIFNISSSDSSLKGFLKSSSLYASSIYVGLNETVNSNVVVLNSADISGNILGSLLILNEDPNSSSLFNDGSTITFSLITDNWVGPPLGLRFKIVKGSWREF